LTFKNIDCISPNKFILNSLDTGIYFGLIEMNNNGKFYLTIDSIQINPGRNIINKELNIGSISLPN
jgi:hypothetical protein